MVLALMKLPIPKFSGSDWNGSSLCNAERLPSLRTSSADEQKWDRRCLLFHGHRRQLLFQHHNALIAHQILRDE